MTKTKTMEEITTELEVCELYLDQWESENACSGAGLSDATLYAATKAQYDFLIRLQRQVADEEDAEERVKKEEEKFNMRRRPRGCTYGMLVVSAVLIVLGLLFAMTAFKKGYEEGFKKGYEEGFRDGSTPKDIRTMKVTAYCTCPKCCGQYSDGITADGSKAVGLICAADKGIAFGVKVKIPGYGTATVRDRGSAIGEGDLDVLFSSHDEAKQWGTQTIDCEFME